MKDTTFASCITPPAIPPYITAQEGPDACGAQGDTTAHLCGPYYLPPFNCSQLLLCSGEGTPQELQLQQGDGGGGALGGGGRRLLGDNWANFK